jgi:hypothetical protein
MRKIRLFGKRSGARQSDLQGERAGAARLARTDGTRSRQGVECTAEFSRKRSNDIPIERMAANSSMWLAGAPSTGGPKPHSDPSGEERRVSQFTRRPTRIPGGELGLDAQTLDRMTLRRFHGVNNG